MKLSFLTGLVPWAAPKSNLGIEISEEFLKVAVVGHGSQGPKGVFLEGVAIKDLSDDKIAEALSDILKKRQMKYAKASVILPSHLAITKTLQIPSTDDNEIRDILNLQAGRHTPYAREEIVIDYINIGRVKEVYTKVLVIMVPREAIKKRVGIIERVGIKTSRVLFAADGIGKMCSRAIKPSHEVPYALLNIDIELSDFHIFNDRGLIFTRGLPVGSRAVLEDKEKGLPRFIEELKKSFESYQAEDVAKNPGVLFVAASAQVFSDVSRPLADEFKVDAKEFLLSDHVTIEEPFQQLVRQHKPTSFLASLSTLITADDLTIDLIPEEVKLQRRFEEKGKKIIIVGVLAMVIFFQVCLIFITKMYYTDLYYKRLTNRYKEKIDEANTLRLLSEKTRMLRTYVAKKGDMVTILARLYDILPDEIYLKGVKVEEDGKIFIKGMSGSMSRIFAFVTELENDALFKGVKTEFTESKKEQGQDVSEFGLVMMLER